MTRGTAGAVAAAAIAATAVLGWWLLGGDAGRRPSTDRPGRSPAGGSTRPAPDGPPAPDEGASAAVESAPDSGPAGPEIRGVVVDREGKPIAGARVQARTPPSFARVDLRAIPDAVFDGVPPRAEAKTGADGAFALRGLAPGRWDVTASASGHAPATEPGVVLHAALPGPPVRLVLGPGHGLLVRVLDAAGAPVEGAAVAAAIPMMGPIPSEEALARGTTDGSGEARLEGLPPGGLLVAARAGGRIAGRTVTLPGEDEVEIRLGGAATLVIRVVDGAGEPVPGAEVLAMVDSAVGDGGELLRGTTSEDGEARFDDVAEGRVSTVTATRSGYATGVLGRQGEPIHVEAAVLVDGATRRLEVRLRAGATLLGTVLLQPAGSPVPGAKVTVLVPGQFGILPARSAVADASGAYRVEDLPAGRVFAFAHGTGVATPGAMAGGLPVPAVRRRSEHAPSALVLEIAAGPAETRHDIPVEATGTVSGRVLGADGTPAAGARVGVRPAAGTTGGPEEPGEDLPPGTAVTGEDGAFRIEGVPRAEGLVATAALDRRVPAASETFSMPAGGTVEGIELRLGAGGVVVGRVDGPDGKPVPGARLRLFLRRPPTAVSLVGSHSEAYAGLDGEFRIEGVPAGATVMSATADGFVPKNVSGIDVKEGTETRTDVALEAGLSIRGRVVDSKGQPAAGVRVRARNIDRRHPSGVRQGNARTARDGSFSVPDLPAATFDLEANSRDHPTGSMRGVAPGGPPVEIRLPEAVSISGRATDPSGNPIGGIRVHARGERGQGGGNATAAEDGTFEVRGLAPGPYSLRARSPTQGWKEAAVEGIEGGTRGVEIRMARAIGISGKVLAPDGSPAGGRGRIRVLDGNGKQVGSTRWDGQGGFQIRNLAEGTFTLVARVEGPPVLEASVTVRAGPDPIEIRLAPE